MYVYLHYQENHIDLIPFQNTSNTKPFTAMTNMHPSRTNSGIGKELGRNPQSIAPPKFDVTGLKLYISIDRITR